MKFRLEIEVVKAEGDPKQEPEAVKDALIEEIEALTIEAADDEHDEPSVYEVRSVRDAT